MQITTKTPNVYSNYALVIKNNLWNYINLKFTTQYNFKYAITIKKQ